MARTNEKEKGSIEILLTAVLKSQKILADGMPPNASISQDLIIEELLGILDDKKLISSTEELHKQYLFQKEWKKSSNVELTIYDSLLEKLIVHFKGGGIYEYLEVPFKLWKKLLKAESIGKFLHKKVIPNYKALKK